MLPCAAARTIYHDWSVRSDVERSENCDSRVSKIGSRELTGGVCKFVLLALDFVFEALGVTPRGCDPVLHLLARHLGRHLAQLLVWWELWFLSPMGSLK